MPSDRGWREVNTDAAQPLREFFRKLSDEQVIRLYRPLVEQGVGRLLARMGMDVEALEASRGFYVMGARDLMLKRLHGMGSAIPDLSAITWDGLPVTPEPEFPGRTYTRKEVFEAAKKGLAAYVHSLKEDQVQNAYLALADHGICDLLEFRKVFGRSELREADRNFLVYGMRRLMCDKMESYRQHVPDLGAINWSGPQSEFNS